jgi:nucleotide-binding universal stress UspA family protein
MSTTALFLIGVVAVMLMIAFAVLTVAELPQTARPEAAKGPSGGSLAAVGQAGRGLRILIATDGSPCSDRAVVSVATRPWPPGSRVEVVTVVHTRIPAVTDPFLVGAAAHVEALERERERAPERVRQAERQLSALGSDIESRVLEGDPVDVIVNEADRWRADLVVVGTHGYGRVQRAALGSVSDAVVRHASCSVEVVRCPHAA